MKTVEEICSQYGHIWPTSASFFSFIRGGLRRGLWEKHPVKLEFLKKNRFKAPLGKVNKRNPEGLVWCVKCAITGDIVRESEAEVDHLVGNHSLKSEEDLKNFILSMVFITEEDLQIVSKKAHRVKSYSQKQGISFKEAEAEKKAISLCKDKLDKEWLIDNGIKPATNVKLRRKQIVDKLLQENK